jgi:hypothetical protein
MQRLWSMVTQGGNCMTNKESCAKYYATHKEKVLNLQHERYKRIKKAKAAKDMMRKYIMYLIRWQLSTPVLALVLYLMAPAHYILATFVANLVGGLIFFPFDYRIFRNEKKIT